ncbi:MAG: phenylalanine--tRNA ligase subunit beta [Nanoarchaeota archaeon]|nr:phenylalanine--tRNA ligase subunit beta [Nanoarchaeota archaeon]
MPTITFSLEDLSALVGKKLSVDEVDELVEYGKAELENHDAATGEVTVNFDDTNLPYLWSVEGVARMIRGILGIHKGLASITLEAGEGKILVDDSVSTIRPYIAGFIAKGKKVDDYLIKQFIQLQDKLDESFGKRRSKVAIGIYSYEKVKFPIHYKATAPDSVSFIPLGFKKEMTQAEILEEHPKGKEYGSLLEGMEKYPLLIDDEDKVLSFTPIINSDFTGRVQVGDEHLVIEATGTDEEAMHLALNIFAFVFSERGFTIESLEVDYGKRKVVTPKLFDDTMNITVEQVTKITGLDLKKKEIIDLLLRAGYDVNSSLNVSLPAYRRDQIHPYDIVEDIAIAYGFNNFPEKALTSYTIGKKTAISAFRDSFRELCVGSGFQEIMSAYLSNQGVMEELMQVKKAPLVRISNPMSETYSVVRCWILPELVDLLRHNTHTEYPQKIFEAGTVAVNLGNSIEDYEKVALLSAHDKAGFTEFRSLIDYLLTVMGFSYTIEDMDHESFIAGRVGKVVVDGQEIGYLGELHPGVLSKVGLEVPAIGMELNLTKLFEISKKKVT